MSPSHTRLPLIFRPRLMIECVPLLALRRAASAVIAVASGAPVLPSFENMFSSLQLASGFPRLAHASCGETLLRGSKEEIERGSITVDFPTRGATYRARDTPPSPGRPQSQAATPARLTPARGELQVRPPPGA